MDQPDVFWPPPSRAVEVFDDVVSVLRSGFLARVQDGQDLAACAASAGFASMAQRVGLIDIVASEVVLTDFGKTFVPVGNRDLRPYFQLVDEVFRPCYEYAADRMKHGQNAFVAHYGCGYFEHFAKHPRLADLAHKAMQATQSMAEERLADMMDLAQVHSVLDVGGGAGGLARAIARRRRDCEVMVADIDPEAPRRAGMQDVDNVRFLYADFFDAVPNGADLYILKLVLHDWEDADALRILRVLSHAMKRDSALMIIESPLAAPGHPDVTALWDIHQMFTMGGRERRPGEIKALAQEAGLELKAMQLGPDPMVSMVFRKASNRAVEPVELRRNGPPDPAIHASLGLAIGAAHRLWTGWWRSAALDPNQAVSPIELSDLICAEVSATERLLRAWAYMGLAQEGTDGRCCIRSPSQPDTKEPA